MIVLKCCRYFISRRYSCLFLGTIALTIFAFILGGQLPFSNKFWERRSDQVDLAEMASAARRLTSVDFEVFGVVQGVFFRKYTQKEATKLGLVGWVQNTRQGTVVGVIQGAENAVSQMRAWLANTGSPKSKIDRCDTKNERQISQLDYEIFDIVREKGDTKPRKKRTVPKAKVK